MRKYETTLISDPDLQDQNRQELLDKVRNIIEKENGTVLDFEDWGNKKLAYEIKKKLRGHYTCVSYAGDGALVTELERNFRLTDDVLKFMTIVLSEDLTAEELENEIQLLQEKNTPKDEADSDDAGSDDGPDGAGETDEADDADKKDEDSDESSADEKESE